MTVPNFGVDWAKSYQRCWNSQLKFLCLFKILSCVRQGSPQWWLQYKN